MVFFRRKGVFRGKRKFPVRRKRFVRRKRVFRKKRRGGGLRALANKLRKHLTQLKLHDATMATRAAPQALTLGLHAFAEMDIAQGTGPLLRESNMIRWQRYSWDATYLRGHVGSASLNFCEHPAWEFIIWWKGETVAIIANVAIIFRNNADNYHRITDGFEPLQRTNFQVLYSRKYHMRVASTFGTAFNPAGDSGFSLPFTGVPASFLRFSKGSVSLRGKVSRYATAGAVDPGRGMMLHYFVQGDEASFLTGDASVWGRMRFSFYDD